jgi:hypothetical protein
MSCRLSNAESMLITPTNIPAGGRASSEGWREEEGALGGKAGAREQ